MRFLLFFIFSGNLDGDEQSRLVDVDVWVGGGVSSLRYFDLGATGFNDLVLNVNNLINK